MKENKLQQLVKPDAYQVFLLTSQCNLPMSFATHPWFVLNNRGVLSRWEVLFRADQSSKTRNHLRKDFLPPFSGIEIITSITKWCWKAKLLGSVEGELAQQMIDFIERSPQEYPYNHNYSLLGANSNTYVRWILDHFPEFKVRLPWNAFGKHFQFDKKDKW